MTWLEIKDSITHDLLNRNLSNPNIRLNALKKIDLILRTQFPDYVKNPQNKFSNIDRNDFKLQLAKFKENGVLNSAESSVINEIYYRINSI